MKNVLIKQMIKEDMPEWVVFSLEYNRVHRFWLIDCKGFID